MYSIRRRTCISSMNQAHALQIAAYPLAASSTNPTHFDVRRTPFPCLDGTWQGHLQTTWKNPDTGEVPGPIPVLMTIRQTFGRISCVMRTAEMTSRSYCADFWIDNDEQVRKLAYCYTSVASVLILDRSQPHDGAMLFEIIREPAQKLRGNYWTTRKTTGEVTLTFRCRERLDDLPDDFGSHPMEGQ